MAKENRRLKVFICHSKDDKPRVRELYRRLVADGFDAWLDEEKLMPGQDWDLEIRRTVRESDVVVVCLSNDSISKAGYVQKEIRFALDVADEQPEGAIFIIPARLEDCQVPTRLSKWQWVNLFELNGYEKLNFSLDYQADTRIEKVFSFVEPKMVIVPAGKFLMGSTIAHTEQAIKNGADQDWVEREQPQHTVELSDYLIGKYPITNREYQGFVQDAKYNSPRGWFNEFPAEKGGHPVVNVSWDDAIAYCKWLSKKSGKQYRLPTEAEWEKAARGEKGLIYPWGNEFDSKKLNISETKIGETSEVGNFSPQGDSTYGCADMVGNIWEWCSDWYNEYEYKSRKDNIVKDPQGPQTGNHRVLRGGSFNHDFRLARCSFRGHGYPYNSNIYDGFRIALSSSKLESND
jgi:formylglycine-generating enzyme required for sulfatase activity